MPRRIQRKRTKGWRMPAGAVYVGRPTRYGNPFLVPKEHDRSEPDKLLERLTGERVHTVERSLELYELHVKEMIAQHGKEWLAPLRGKDLACFCAEGEPCHADTLLRLANA